MRELYAGRHLRLVVRNGWEFVERPGIRGIVLVVAVTPGDRLLLVEQRRVAGDAGVARARAALTASAS